MRFTRKHLVAALVFSLLVNVAGLLLAALVIQNRGGWGWVAAKFSGASAESAYSLTRRSVFAELEITREDIVILGDSLLSFGEWHELLDDPRVKNRSVSGDTTGKILDRLAPIAEGKPRAVVLHCGINNLQEGIPIDQTLAEYREIVAALSGSTVLIVPVLGVDQPLYRQHVLPRFPTVNTPSPDDVMAINRALGRLAEADNVRLVDVSGLSTEGKLRAEMTIDGLHLNGRGLRLLAEGVRGDLKSSRAPIVQPRGPGT